MSTATRRKQPPRFQAVLDRIEFEPPLPKIPLAERRRMALERLQVAKQPKRRVAQRGRHAASTRGWFVVPRGPAPVGFYVLTVVITLFVTLGLVMVLSASAMTEARNGNSPFALFNQQAIWAAIGAVALYVAMRINLAIVARLALPLIVVTVAMMALPFVPGVGNEINGARAWIQVGPLSMQPSEVLKLSAAIYAADLLVRRQHELVDVRRSLRPLLLLATVAAGACLAQSDLGSAIVMTAIVLVVAFIGGVPWPPMVAAGGVALFGGVAFVVSSPRRLDRFTAFLDIAGHSDKLSYQVHQGMLAIGNGGWTGSGVGAGNGKMGYIPYAESDFIFAVVADELGFIGALAVVGGFAVIAWFGIQAALSARDRFSMLLAGGIAAWFGVQAFVNMGGVVGLLPVTGLTLPFFSSGGTSLLVSMSAAGLLLNVARRGS